MRIMRVLTVSAGRLILLTRAYTRARTRVYSSETNRQNPHKPSFRDCEPARVERHQGESTRSMSELARYQRKMSAKMAAKQWTWGAFAVMTKAGKEWRYGSFWGHWGVHRTEKEVVRRDAPTLGMRLSGRMARSSMFRTGSFSLSLPLCPPSSFRISKGRGPTKSPSNSTKKS
jgi:hypothetical protein